MIFSPVLGLVLPSGDVTGRTAPSRSPRDAAHRTPGDPVQVNANHIIISPDRILTIHQNGAIMGIKPSYIKTIGNELMKTQRDNFSNNFDENKAQLGSSAAIPSKRVRNRIAGYITRKVNTKKRF